MVMMIIKIIITITIITIILQQLYMCYYRIQFHFISLLGINLNNSPNTKTLIGNITYILRT